METPTAFRSRLYIFVALYIVAFNIAWRGEEKSSLYYLLNGLEISSAIVFSVLVVVFAIVEGNRYVIRRFQSQLLSSDLKLSLLQSAASGDVMSALALLVGE